MKKFKLSPECVLEDGSDTVVKELMKGSFVIACDFGHGELILQNVFHYSVKRRSIEYYSLFYDEKTERRKLRLEWAVITQNPKDVYPTIKGVVEDGYRLFDVFVIDKFNNLYTEEAYDKYGHSMKLA